MNTTTENINQDAVEQYLWNIKDTDEIKNLWYILKRRKKQIDEINTRNFSVGDKVSWIHKGRRTTGTVKQVNRKTVSVDEDNAYTTWRISPSILTRE